jgi:hypothetical protein
MWQYTQHLPRHLLRCVLWHNRYLLLLHNLTNSSFFSSQEKRPSVCIGSSEPDFYSASEGLDADLDQI